MSDGERQTRVVFYQPVEFFEDPQRTRAFDLLRAQHEALSLGSLNDALELVHALMFLEHEAFPSTFTDDERRAFPPVKAELKRAINGYVRALDATSLTPALADVEPEYARGVIDLVLRHARSIGVPKAELIQALLDGGIPLTILLESKKLVQDYSEPISAVLLQNPLNAEFWIQKRLVSGGAPSIFLPEMTPHAIKEWLSQYIEHEHAHINNVQMIVEAPNQEKAIIDKKVRLKAARRYDQLAEEMMENEASVMRSTTTGVRIDPDLKRGAKLEISDDGSLTLDVSEKHLLNTLDYASIINNFESTFSFLEHSLLWMPSYRAELSVFQVLRMEGAQSYPRGSVFNRKNALTLMALNNYRAFLDDQGIVLEEVLAWFYNDYLREEFGAEGFHFQPPSPGSTWVEKIRHLTAETEGIAGQFALYSTEGEIDRDLFEIESGGFQWNSIPSLIPPKNYLENPASQCGHLMYLLFSSQSGLTYINDTLKASSFEELVTSFNIELDGLNEYFRSRMQLPLDHGLLEITEGILSFPEPEQILVLHELYSKEAVPVSQYVDVMAEAAGALLEKGLLQPSSLLLSPAESQYFEFWMNKRVFSDGPDLRNRYAHGNSPAPTKMDVHAFDYLCLLRILVALTLKIRNDFRDRRAKQGS